MLIDVFKTIILGIIEGITEWLPISSTGHMIIAEEFLKLEVSAEFWEMFLIVIQLGAIFAIVVLFFKNLFPWGFNKTKKETKDTFNLWYKIIIGCLPAALIGIPLSDKIDELFFNPGTVALMLIIYGILFIIVENKQKNKNYRVKEVNNITCKDALLVGLFQVLSLIPGTSRSGATILGGLIIGLDRTVAASYTFYLAVPVMLGASLIKLLKFGFVFSSSEIIILIIGMLTAFIISILTIKLLLKYIKKNDFKVFGYYRILLGLVVILYFLLK
ncbi:MAG: undecaprenyl-diphosphate phosphatase [Bacilli bacterium]|nr:undecaprenyl-diphosphate phosphatase [Bacilli bacterium]MDD4406706.1 undecaprenyl-diphosphate phosphatase [Bacilli bacterium]